MDVFFRSILVQAVANVALVANESLVSNKTSF
jgi:hypothetical protein